MRITSHKGDDLATLEQWKVCVRSNHWKKGRSAYSLADFILNRNGAKILATRIASILGQPVKLETATPEFRASFDHYRGNPSNLDLGIFGLTDSKSNLFVGLEAKVDESFGDKTLCERYLAAVRELTRNPRSRACDRVKNLLSLYFSETSEPCDSRFSKVGYQLLTGTAGTVARQKDVSIFYVLVFRTSEYDEHKGKANWSDFERFTEVAGGKPLNNGQSGLHAHELTVGGRRLICVYDYFQML